MSGGFIDIQGRDTLTSDADLSGDSPVTVTPTFSFNPPTLPGQGFSAGNIVLVGAIAAALIWLWKK